MNTIDILKIRENLGLTQKEFGELIGVDKRTIINYEQGKVIPATRQKFLQLILDKGIGNIPKDRQTILPLKRKSIVEADENLRVEILDLKDHIKTLKELIGDKNKITEMYKNENMLLREKMVVLEEKVRVE